MKVVVVGGRGTIGSAIVQELSPRHELLTVGRSHGNISCDITSEESIKAMFAKIGPFDALISAAGNTLYEDFSHMTPSRQVLYFAEQKDANEVLRMCLRYAPDSLHLYRNNLQNREFSKSAPRSSIRSKIDCEAAPCLTNRGDAAGSKSEDADDEKTDSSSCFGIDDIRGGFGCGRC